MNRSRFSTIAHRDHVFSNPLSEAKVDRVLALLELAAGDRVLDVGCGKGELLIRMIERHGVVGVGVDPNGDSLAEARERARGRIPPERLQLQPVPISDFAGSSGDFAAALCIGATHAYGGYRRTLSALKAAVRSGGHLLIGEGYWKRAPDPAYLAFLDTSSDELSDHAGNVAGARAAGLVPLYSIVSDEDEWDHYEGLYCRAVERYVAEHPDDPESAEYGEYIRRWYAGYLQWGRETLGFALYLMRSP